MSSVATATVALVFVPGAVAAGVWWLDSYYVQKALNASLLVTAPIIAAAVGVGVPIHAAGGSEARFRVQCTGLVSMLADNKPGPYRQHAGDQEHLFAALHSPLESFFPLLMQLLKTMLTTL